MKQRRRWSLWAGILYAVILAAVAIGLGGLYTASRDRLDEAMGERLLAVARSLTGMIDAERVFAFTIDDPSAAAYLDSLARRLEDIQEQNALAEITLNDPDGRVLWSTLPNLKPGAANDYWELDPAAVDLAGQGFARTTKLYRLQQTFQKSAHAPVLLLEPGQERPLVVGVLTVSGSPDFFESLARLRRAAFGTASAVLVVLVLLGFFLHRVNRSLERAQASILQQENLAAMGRMTAGIAHEIRNPLGIIRGTGEHLQRVLADAGIEDETAGFIPEEVDRLDRILSGYLAFGTDRTGPTEDFDPAMIVARSIHLVESEMSERGVTIEFEPPAMPAVHGDPRRLQQVVLNLLLNARDAMPDGGEIHVSFTEFEGRIDLTVTDHGAGLGSRDPERLFEPFYTTKEKGSGLGLALSRRIVEEMGGTLTLAECLEWRGAVASVRLPAAVGGGA